MSYNSSPRRDAEPHHGPVKVRLNDGKGDLLSIRSRPTTTESVLQKTSDEPAPARFSARVQSCPHCGQQLPPKLLVTGRERKKLVDILSRCPNGITRADLAERLYADDIDGGPDNTFAICQLVHQARKQLKPQGYTIVSNRGPGAQYRLVSIS